MSYLFPKMKSLAVALCAFCALAAPLPSAARSADNAADPNWTVHSAFYNTPRRIIDTPDKVYFVVHPGFFNAYEQNYYYVDVAASIFCLDKNNPQAGLQDFTQKIPFSSLNMALVEVNPDSGVMAAAYTDGGLDIVSPDGKVHYISFLRDAHDYRMSKITSLRFDSESGDLLVATKGGFIRINTSSKKVTLSAEWRQDVADVVITGQRALAIIDNKVCEASPDDDLRNRSAFKEIPGATSSIPMKLLYFSDEWAGYLADNGHIYLLQHKSDGSWAKSDVANVSDAAKEKKNIFLDKFEHTLFHIPRGYAINSPTKIYLIQSPEDGGKPVFSAIAAPLGATQFAGTADGENFWFHQNTGKFVARTLNGNSWSDASEPITPDCPHGAKDVYFIHSPEYGFLCISKYPGLKSMISDILMPLNITSFRNGHWTDLSPRTQPPYFAEENPTTLANFNNSPWYPMIPAHGALIDPIYPNMLITASNFYSCAALHLDDPRLKPHVYTYKDSPYISLFGAQEVFPKSNWNTYTGLYLLGSDADDNIWAARSNLFEPSGTSGCLSQLWVLTKEARKATFESNNPDLGSQWKHMEIESDGETLFYEMGIALRHPKNKNKFLLNGQLNNGNGRCLRIYNTNGTFDDMSDDTLEYINYFRRDDGCLAKSDNIYNYFEDPKTGDVYTFSNIDLFILDLDTPVENATMQVRSLSIKDEDGNMFTPFAPTRGFDACEDEFGRLWIATSNVGVYGISADRKKLVAHFNKDNSPLTSNCVYAVGWNPDTKSLFMSTSEAIFEVKVDAPAETSANFISGQNPRIYPLNVTPEFAGTVTIFDIPAGVALRVRDSQGNSVAVIDSIQDGIAHWNLLDSDGNQVKSDVYTIDDASGISDFEPIRLPVVR